MPRISSNQRGWFVMDGKYAVKIYEFPFLDRKLTIILGRRVAHVTACNPSIFLTLPQRLSARRQVPYPRRCCS